ncbi:MAG: AAA family ATPase, partial [Caldilineaceae bacterium]|nr:AAA family ATPase [Caldilineaceae bacterium]
VTVLRRELDVAPGQATHEIYERLLNASVQPSAPPPETAIPLIGRTTEWAQLQQMWREARARPGLALIAGEVGIGKTRLAEALVEWVGRQGIPVLTARCYAAGGELAYAPVAAWLRSGPRSPLADPWLRELARLLPELLVEQPHLPPPEPLTEKWQRLRLFEALTHAVLTGRRSLLLFLDDLQWCDRDTLDWLAYLLQGDAARKGAVHLLVVATLRRGEGDATALAPWVAGLRGAGHLTEIELGPLRPEAALALADSIAGRPFDRALAPLLYQGTEGYPLFIVEMVRAGRGHAVGPAKEHAAGMAGIATTLPERVRQVLAARLAQLSPPARSTVELAAVIGRAFTYGVLALATDLSEDSLVAALDECWHRRIIREQGGEAYDFSHEKLREAAYTGLSRTRQRWLHGRVAGALAYVHAVDLDRVAGVLAGHYEAAGQPAQAIACYERAAAAARRVYAHGDARAALERAISLLDALPHTTHCAQAAQLHEALGDLQELLTQHGPARAAYTAALACTPDANAVTQARLHRKIGKTLENERAGYEQVVAEYAAAETLLGAPDDGRPEAAWWDEWCQVQLDRLILLYWWRRPDEMAHHIGRVQPLVEQHGTPTQRAALFGNLARMTGQSCRYAPSDAALAYARAALAAVPPAASPEARTPYQFALGFYLLWHGDPAEAEAELRTALAMSEQIGDISQQARCLAYLAVAQRRQGHVAEVEAYARCGLTTAEAAKMLDYSGASLAGLAWVTWHGSSGAHTADLTDAERLAQAALAAWQRQGVPYPFYWQALWPLIGVALAGERHADAISHARRLLEPGQQVLPPDLAVLVQAAVDAWDAGRTAAAADRLCAALELAQRTHFS